MEETHSTVAVCRKWFESEIPHLSHLRDGASENEKKKELRECVEKLQILKTPDGRSRRLDDVPEVHADPKMDLCYESNDKDSESNEGKRDVYMRAGDSSFSQGGDGPVTPKSDFSPKDSWFTPKSDFSPKDSQVAAGKNSSKNWELNRSSGTNLLSRIEDGVHSGSRLNDVTWSEVGNRVTESKNPERLISIPNSNATEQNSQFLSRMESFSGASSLSSPATFQSKVPETSTKINEADNMWHYKDPSGKIQGPFSVVQLHKWSNRGYFPADLRIWRTTDKQEDSILLTEVLAGKFEKVPSAGDHGTWVAAAPKGEPNISALAPGQLQGYGNWGTVAASIQNLAVAPLLPQSDYWRAPAQGQPNMQPTTVPSVPWGVGLQENTSSASALRAENNTGWVMMPVNPNVGWVGSVPPMMNVNWGATVQAMPPGNTNPGWVSTGPVPGSSNPGWSTQSGIPGVQGLAPGKANTGWIAPTVSVGATMGTGNTGAVIQGPIHGDSNLGKGAATGSRGTRNNDRHQDRRFSGQSDRGYSGTWNRQSSSGSRGPGSSSRDRFKRNIPCPYNTRCTMGSRCNYLH